MAKRSLNRIVRRVRAMSSPRNIDPAIRRSAMTAGVVAGRSVALAEEAARNGLVAARKVSSGAARAFLKGFKKGHGKAKKIA